MANDNVHQLPSRVAHLTMPEKPPRPAMTVVVRDAEGREVYSLECCEHGMMMIAPDQRDHARRALIEALGHLQPWGT